MWTRPPHAAPDCWAAAHCARIGGAAQLLTHDGCGGIAAGGGGPWLYLASGLKLWYVSPFERGPPVEAQWSVPHKSWLRPSLHSGHDGRVATAAHDSSSNSSNALAAAMEAWAPLVCMQRPGDVLVLPAFWWHATVSLGSTVAFGRQQPHRAPEFPPLIQALRAARTKTSLMDAQWDMYEASNRASLKLLVRMDGSASRYEIPTEQRKVRDAAREAIARAAALAQSGAITEQDARDVQASLAGIVDIRRPRERHADSSERSERTQQASAGSRRATAAV